MFAWCKWSRVDALRFSLLASLAVSVCALPSPAWAQAASDEEEEEELGEMQKTPGAVGVTAQDETTEPSKPAAATAADKREPIEPASAFDGLFRGAMKLGWDGGAEIDTGYARYDYDLPSYNAESFYDLRGRFVMGPVLEYDFDEKHFLRVTGQAVAWVREERNLYQVNADDVYFQVGRRSTWDFKLGRFESWDVYHKGLGFDKYTLDDTGALRQPTFDTQLFGVDMYEVNAIYWREMAGKAALHVYPLDVLGFELVGLWGSERTTNHIGARLAADLNLKFLRVTAGAEYRKRDPSVEVTSLGPNGEQVPCDKCSDRTQLGFGGGAVVSLGPVELAANAAKLDVTAYKTDGSAEDLAGTTDITTFGGYLQLDPGKLLLDRSLIVGVGANRTESVIANGDFDRHTQAAAYVAFPLGFNDAMVKLVLSRADLLVEDADSVTGIVTARNSDMVAGRVRVRCSF